MGLVFSAGPITLSLLQIAFPFETKYPQHVRQSREEAIYDHKPSPRENNSRAVERFGVLSDRARGVIAPFFLQKSIPLLHDADSRRGLLGATK